MTSERAAEICQYIKFILKNEDYTEEVEEALDMAIEALEQEQKRGEWERFNYYDGDVMECTNCGYRDWRDRWLEDEVHNYCPNCGARMESDTE